jgi:agmatinase
MIQGAFGTPFNFAGLPDELSICDSAQVVVLPVPYDLTTSYQAGTRRGPHAIIDASTHLELFDEELCRDISSVGIHTLAQLEQTTAGPEQMIMRIEEASASIIAAAKFPLMLGGEHSITTGMVRAFKDASYDFGVLQLDAHADLRDTFEGSPYNHACVGRRIHEMCSLTQVGLRSLSAEEHAYQKSSNIHAFFAKDIYNTTAWRHDCLASLPENVYITIDLDVFDPAIMPATGTPEPGGLDWYTVISLLRDVAAAKTVLGCDVVELSPQPYNPAPDFLAAKLCYKLLGYVFA